MKMVSVIALAFLFSPVVAAAQQSSSDAEMQGMQMGSQSTDQKSK